MIFLRTILAAAIVATTFGVAQVASVKPAEAQGFGLRIGGPNVGVSIGRYPRYGYTPYRYGYRSGPPPYYARGGSGGRCEVWSRRCAANWGYRNNDYRGCMRYYNCR